MYRHVSEDMKKDAVKKVGAFLEQCVDKNSGKED